MRRKITSESRMIGSPASEALKDVEYEGETLAEFVTDKNYDFSTQEDRGLHLQRQLKTRPRRKL